MWADMHAKKLVEVNKVEEAHKLYVTRVKEDADDWTAYLLIGSLYFNQISLSDSGTKDT